MQAQYSSYRKAREVFLELPPHMLAEHKNTEYIDSFADHFRGQRFGARAHLLPITVPIFLKYENASKNSEKNWT